MSTIAWAKGIYHLAEGNIALRLSNARMWHSLFQHHDGVSGTARDNVVIDYAQKMILALNNTAHVLQQSVMHLLKTSEGSTIDQEVHYLSLDETRFENRYLFLVSIFCCL